MFKNSNGELVTKTIRENDGITFELVFKMNLHSDEVNNLKDFRENFAKTSPLHFHFEDENFSFSQKKYFKKKQFVKDPPKIEDIEKGFLENIKTTLHRYKNFVNFDKIQEEEKRSTIDIMKHD